MELLSPARVHDRLIAAFLEAGPRPLAPGQGRLLLQEGQYIFQWVDGDGEEHVKLVSGAAVAQAFSGQPQDSGWLPPGTVRWGNGTHGPWAMRTFAPAVYHLPCVLPDSPTEVTWLTVPLPGLVFVGLGRTYWIWALAEPFTPQAVAYLPPLPNTQAHGHICWGSGNAVPDATAANFAAAWELFCTAPFNDHVVGGKSRAYPQDVRRHLMALAAAEAPLYPVADLVPFRHGQTLLTVDDMTQRVLHLEGRA